MAALAPAVCTVETCKALLVPVCCFACLCFHSTMEEREDGLVRSLACILPHLQVVFGLTQVTRKDALRGVCSRTCVYRSLPLLVFGGAVHLLLASALFSQALSRGAYPPSFGRISLQPNSESESLPRVSKVPWESIRPSWRPSFLSSRGAPSFRKKLFGCLSPYALRHLRRSKLGKARPSSRASTASPGCKSPSTLSSTSASPTADTWRTDRAAHTRSSWAQNEVSSSNDERGGQRRNRRREESGLWGGPKQREYLSRQDTERINEKSRDRKKEKEGHTGKCYIPRDFPASPSRKRKRQVDRSALHARGRVSTIHEQQKAKQGHFKKIPVPGAERATPWRKRTGILYVFSTISYSPSNKMSTRLLRSQGRRWKDTGPLLSSQQNGADPRLWGTVLSFEGRRRETEFWRPSMLETPVFFLGRAPRLPCLPCTKQRPSVDPFCRRGQGGKSGSEGMRFSRDSCLTRLMMMNAVPPGTAFEKKVFECADNPIDSMPWETYVPFYKMHSLEDNTWLQFMKGNWTYADGRKMFDKPAGVIDGGQAAYDGLGTSLPLNPLVRDRQRAQPIPKHLDHGVEFRETVDRPHRICFDRMPSGSQDVYFGETDVDLEERLWGAFHHQNALEEQGAETGWRDILPQYDPSEMPVPWTHAKSEFIEMPYNSRDPSSGPPIAPLEFDMAAAGRFGGYFLDPGWTRQFDYVEQYIEMRKWDEEEMEQDEEVEADSVQPQSDVDNPSSHLETGKRKQKKKRRKHKWLDDPVFREAYERGQLIIRTRYADIRQHPVYKKAIYEGATHDSAVIATNRATPDTIVDMWLGKDVAADLPKVGGYDHEGGGCWNCPEGEGKTIAINMFMEDVVPHGNCYMSPKMTKEEMAEMWHYWMTEAHREGRYTDFSTEIGCYSDIEYEDRADRRKFPRLMALYKPLWSHRKYGDEFGDALRPSHTPPDTAFSEFGAPLFGLNQPGPRSGPDPFFCPGERSVRRLTAKDGFASKNSARRQKRHRGEQLLFTRGSKVHPLTEAQDYDGAKRERLRAGEEDGKDQKEALPFEGDPSDSCGVQEGRYTGLRETDLGNRTGVAQILCSYEGPLCGSFPDGGSRTAGERGGNQSPVNEEGLNFLDDYDFVGWHGRGSRGTPTADRK